MQLFLLLQFLIFVNASLAQENPPVYLDRHLKVTRELDQAAFTALVHKSDAGWACTAYYSGNNGKAFTGTFKDKKLTTTHGAFTIYYPRSGVVMATGQYANGLWHDVWQSWHENGHKNDSGRMDKGKMTGEWKRWYENGHLQSQGIYMIHDIGAMMLASNDQPHNNAAIANALQYWRREVMQGLWVRWYANGQIKDSVRYEKGLKEGIFRSWHENGLPESVGVYEQNREISVWNWYYSNGMPRTEEMYENGKVKHIKCFDTTGKYQGDFCSINKAAWFKNGGTEGFKDYMLKALPQPGIISTKPDAVSVSFTIDTAGRATDIVVENAPNTVYQDSIKKLLENMPAWEPAIYHNLISAFPVTLKIPYGHNTLLRMMADQGDAAPQTDFRHRTMGSPMPQFYDVNWRPEWIQLY